MNYQNSLQPISCSLSLSSCRLKAEAIARALNNRIWPGALLNDCGDHSSGDEALQVTASLKGPCGTRSTAVIDRPPQSHDIYDSGDKVIGHCWINGMQTDDDEEYFDTPPCSSPPSPAEEEIIVNPPTHNGIPPFFTEYHFEEHEPHPGEELPSFSEYRDDERIASGTKLFEKLKRYSESLSQTEEGSETFYDVSDYEDYEEQSSSVPHVSESDRSERSSDDVTQSTEASGSAGLETVENETLITAEENENENSDPTVLLSDVNTAMNSEANEENRVASVDSENPVASENSPASEKFDSISANSEHDEAERDTIHIIDDPLHEEHSSADEVLKISESDPHSSPEEVLKISESDPHSSYTRRQTIFVKPEDVDLLSGKSSLSCPDIGVVSASLPNSTSFSSSSYSDDEIRELPTDRVAESSDNHLPADFRLRRIQELEEEDRPKLSRSTSLKTGKTPPGTPGSKKIVRFADALGLDLEAVRHIVQDDLPNVPSSAYTDLNLSELDDSQQKPLSRATNNRIFPCSLWQPVGGPGPGSGAQSLIPQFQPPSENPDFRDRVRRQFVCLESFIVSDLTLHCTCRVLNTSFEKFVAARYTTNEWQTCEEVVASYVPNSSDGEFDKFSFSLFLRYLLPHQRLLFAIRYIVGEKEHWDNNYGQNYALRSHSNAPAMPSAEDGSSWMHHFY